MIQINKDSIRHVFYCPVTFSFVQNLIPTFLNNFKFKFSSSKSHQKTEESISISILKLKITHFHNYIIFTISYTLFFKSLKQTSNQNQKLHVVAIIEIIYSNQFFNSLNTIKATITLLRSLPHCFFPRLCERE